MRKTSTNALVACSLALLLASPALAQDVLWQTLFDAAAQTRANGTLAEAQKQYEAALKAADNDDRKVKTERALSTVLDEQGKYAEAMALCQQVLASDQATTGTPDREYGKDFNSFALVCQHAGKYAEAETAFNQALERFAHGGESASTALILINLAQLKQETAQYDAVEPLYKRALAIYNEKSADQLALARCLSLYAAFCRLESRYSEAQAMLERSLAIRKNELGETSPLVAQSLADIGRLYGDQGDYTKAESQLRRALSTCELAGADRTDVADIAMDLADLLHQDERYDEARQMYLRALDIRQKAFGSDSAKVAETLRHLGQNCIEQDAYAKAEVYLIKALQADEKAFGELNPALAVDLQTLGLVFLDQGKYADAEKFYLRAVKVDEDALGKDHPETATALNNLAWLYYNEGHYEQAEPLVRRALAIRQSHYGAQHPFTAQNLSNLGVILGAQKKYEEGEKVLQQAIAAEQASLGPDHPAISLNLKNLAVLYQQSNNLPAAEDTLRKLLSRDEKAQGSQSAAVAADLAALSRILTSEHKADDAADALTRSRAITSKLPGAASSGPGIIAPATPLPAGKAPPAVADKWALVIGISNFKDPDINLKYAAKDATDFRNYLLSDEHFKPDHVKLLTDTGATRENIVGALGDKWLGKVAGCNDLVVIFISSHGSAAKQETGGTNFVVPYEGTMDNLIFTGIPMQWLTVGLSDLVHCNRIVLLLDVCHGGAAAQQNRSTAASDPAAQPDAKELASDDSGIADSGMKGMVRQPMKNGVDAAHLPAGEGQLILASSQANQLSWESKNYQNGVFTHCLIEGLKLRQDKTTLDQAYAYMREKVEEEVLRDRGEIQTPVLVKHWRGDDASLGVMPSSPRPGLTDSTPPKKPAK